MSLFHNYSILNLGIFSVPDSYYASIRYFAEKLFINDDLKSMYLSVPKVK